MSAVFRLMDVVIGHKCEIDDCLLPCVDEETRCYDHSHNRMIEELFDFESVSCRFGGVTCQGQATSSNEHDVPMCDACHNIYQRIQVGRANRPGTTYDGRSYHRNINWEGLIESAREEAEARRAAIAIDEEQYASFMRGMLGIPPMRRDEGEETE